MDEQQLMTEVGAYEAIQSDSLADVGGGGDRGGVDGGDDENENVLTVVHFKTEPSSTTTASNNCIDLHVKCTQCNRVGFFIYILRVNIVIFNNIICCHLLALSQSRRNGSPLYCSPFNSNRTVSMFKMQPEFCITRWTVETSENPYW